ncbi:MAG: cytochrome c oxidase subunit II [Paracoccaceae bacterium]
MRFLTSLHRLAAFGVGSALAFASSASAEALQKIGEPHSEGMGFQPASSETAVVAQGLDHMLLIICTVIVVFVTLLLLFVIWKFGEKRNPVARKFTHNSTLEVAWTLIPILVLVFIGSFSLPALFQQEELPAADVLVKVTGNQWYWSYEYPDAGVSFDSVLLDKDKLEAAGYAQTDYLLAADNALVVPVNKNIVVQVTASDVMHAWAVPAFAVMHSAVPGRLGQLWFKAEKEGIYFGQCTTLCGSNHAYMPIVVKVVSQQAYDAWLAQAKTGNYTLASN